MSMPFSSLRLQVDPPSMPLLPGWIGEIAAMAHILSQTGIIATIEEQVRFARARFGIYDTIDFVMVLLCYALSGEPTLAAFYERLIPFQDTVLALFHRHRFPSRSALSRFLAALNEETVEALRTQFFQDLLQRATPFSSLGGLWDRLGQHAIVIDVDGTRQPARQRALPHHETLPEPHRRLDRVAAPGYLGRRRGEAVRTRTIVMQAHTHQWLGTFAGSGNGSLQGTLQRACALATTYASKHRLPSSRILLRLDGGYGDTAVLSDILAVGLGVIVRSRDYALLGRPEVLAVLERPPAASCTHPESGMTRALYDCPSLHLLPKGPCVRVLIATHPVTDDPPVGKLRDGVVYELFICTLLAPAMTAKDVLDLYFHRGAFETTLADEDREQDPDRWCSHTPWGQEFWQILSQWVWNLRLECGGHCAPIEVRTLTFAEAGTPFPEHPSMVSHDLPPKHDPPALRRLIPGHDLPSDGVIAYGPPQWAQPSFTGGFPGSAFRPQPDGTLLCPAGKVLTLAERRQERAGSIRVSYIADVQDCSHCPLRIHCQKRRTYRARRVSAVYWPLSLQSVPPPLPPPPANAPVLWRDWPRCQIRRHWLQRVRTQTVDIAKGVASPSQDSPAEPATRAQRSHWRCSWEQRRVRNVRPLTAPPVTITLHGLPVAFAQFYGFELSPKA